MRDRSLGQAEHGPDSPAILITNSRKLAEDTMREVERLLQILPTAHIASKAWEAYGEVVVCEDEAEMVRVFKRLVEGFFRLNFFCNGSL